MELTIPEAILLLVMHDETGKPVVDDSTVGISFAAGAAAQLVLEGRIRLADERDVAAGAKPGTFVEGDGDAQGATVVDAGAADAGGTDAGGTDAGGTHSGDGDARLEPLVEHCIGRTPKDALAKVVGLGGAGTPVGKARAQTLEDFAEAGLLARQDQRFLGITWSHRWLRGERTAVEDALQHRARQILQGEARAASAGQPGAAPVRDEVLVPALAILHSARALTEVFRELPKEQVIAAGRALAADDWLSDSVRESLKALEGVMAAIMVATVIVPTVTS